jgi:type 1 glutamine amidotransferase
MIKKIFFTVALLGFAATTWSQVRPGKDRPIRVAMFRGTGTGSAYWHTNIHTSHTVMASLLANPRNASLGDSLIVPDSGFTFRTMATMVPAPPTVGTGPDGTCANTGCGPDAATIASFISYLQDSADVLILSCGVNFGTRVNTTQRQVIADFWTNKAYIGIHAISDSRNGGWATIDTIHGTQFNNHPSEQVARLRIDSVFQTDSNWRYLNKGMFSNGVDSTFIEEWFFYTNSGAQIRARAYLKPTVKLVETGMNISNPVSPMGDHPLSWFRQLPTGGRVFYTGLGHRANVWQQTRAFRRQVYNAILWTAKYDSLGTSSSIHPGHKAPGAMKDYSRLSVAPGALTVTMIPGGNHSVELLSMDGKRVGLQSGEGSSKAYNFTGLRSGVYAVAVTTSAGRASRLVTIQ